MQPPAVLRALAGGQRRERTFETPVLLTRGVDEENIITVSLPGMAHDASSRRECRVVCTQPAPLPRRQAHILVINIHKMDTITARNQALKALQAFPGEGDRCTMDHFSDGGRVYGPLVGENAVPEKIYPELIRIGRNLRLRAEAGFTHDVVFIHYDAGERVTAQTHVFRTFDSAYDPELKWSGIPCQHLRSFFSESPGSVVLMLDMVRDPVKQASTGVLAGDMVANWPPDPHTAVMRFAWTADPKAPRAEEARLIVQLGEAWGKAHRLGDVIAQVASQFVQTNPEAPRLSKQFPNTIYDEYMAAGLRGLPLRQ
jgi:hypothetical protein